jgi:hypothetical protein
MLQEDWLPEESNRLATCFVFANSDVTQVFRSFSEVGSELRPKMRASEPHQKDRERRWKQLAEIGNRSVFCNPNGGKQDIRHGNTSPQIDDPESKKLPHLAARRLGKNG